MSTGLMQRIRKSGENQLAGTHGVALLHLLVLLLHNMKVNVRLVGSSRVPEYCTKVNPCVYMYVYGHVNGPS